MNKFDIIIIGGGAAGMMASISAKRHNPNFSVAIIDRTFALGRKILIAGAGRCNISNINLKDKIDTSYYGAPLDFIHGVFDQFGYSEIEQFFNDLGIELYVERKTNIGKVFPVTNQAQTVTELMIDEIGRLGVKVFLNYEVQRIQDTGNKIQDSSSNFKISASEIDKSGKILGESQFECSRIIISAGGKTYPALGSNGSMYPLLTDLGHSVIHPVPSALPLEGSNQLSHLLQGQKMEIEVTTILEGKEIKTRSDDVMFTKYGFSGPCILNVSREVSIHFHRENKNNAAIKLNFFPGKDKVEVKEIFEARWLKRPDQLVEKSLYGIFPNKIANALIRYMGIDTNTKNSKLSSEQKEKIIDSLTNTRIKITGTRGWNEAEFTAGGINSSEIEIGTLKSKLVPNLYICGEIIDVDGDVGGFNLSWSWASGFVAGLLKS